MAYFRIRLPAMQAENIHPVRYRRANDTTIRGSVLHLRDGTQGGLVNALTALGVVVFDDYVTAPATAPALLKRHLFYESPGYWEREEPRESGRRLVVVRTLLLKLLGRHGISIRATPAARAVLDGLPQAIKEALRARAERIDPDDGADLEPLPEIEVAEAEEDADAPAVARAAVERLR